ncbi:MAG: alpha/beta hydrolase [Methylothermaceae bacterium]|nr:alpha/beta hydrolase [Methylothermaceae bacterium]
MRGEIFLMSVLCCLLSGCLAPAKLLDRQAQSLGLTQFRLRGEHFEHIAYANDRRACTGGGLHVYLEGDGIAWLTKNRVSPDPTPDHSCLLPLMAKDPAPAVYLGRPCYHGLAHAAGCRPRLWTQARYGEAVVASMTAALRRIVGDKPCRPVLIGYSGGGTLAMLMAARSPAVGGVVTLAGNLNVAEWSERHGYSPLEASYDPARQSPLSKNIFQIHIAGERDDNIPLTLIRKEAGRQPNARLIVLPELNHRCPGDDIWPGILVSLTVLEKNNTRPAKKPSSVRLER